MTSKKLAVFLILFMYAFNIKAQTAEDIISKYIAFTGGGQQWKTINTVVLSGIYNYGGIEFPFTAYSKRPRKYKFIVPFNGKYYAQAFDGKTGWKIDAFKNETQRTPLTGKAALAMANEADVELESPFINYQEKGHRIVLAATDTVEGKVCFKIKLIKGNGETETCFFSSDNFALVKKNAVSKNQEMEDKTLDTFYSDYRETNGVKIPFKSISKAGEQTILTITINKAEMNVPVADSEFE